MERLCCLAMGVPIVGLAYKLVHGTLYQGTRKMESCSLHPCNVQEGYRTWARKRLARRWVRSRSGFVRMADPLHNKGLVFFGWQAPAVRGGACGGHL